MLKNDYRIIGEDVEIYITRKDKSEHILIVDLSELERLDKTYQGKVWLYEYKNNLYARGLVNGKDEFVHRIVKKAKNKEVVDHINHDGLDNRKDNLRIVTVQENSQNRKSAQSNNVTGIRGVSWKKDRKKYAARVVVNGKDMFLGYFDCKYGAEKVAAQKRKELGFANSHEKKIESY